MVCLSDYAFGRVKVGDCVYRRDLIVYGEEVLSPWMRREAHRLFPDDLQWVLSRAPRVIVVGTGAVGRLSIPQETVDSLAGQGITLVGYRTARAVEEYNTRLKRGERIACCLHLTC